MSASPPRAVVQPASPPSLTALVSTLRAAGCVFAEEEAQLLVSEARTPAHLATMVSQRVAGLPLEHVLGWVEFCGLRIAVALGVFIPRRRTEFLVHRAAALVRPQSMVVDLCCGSGAIGVALSAVQDTIELHATDIDPAAVRCARRNLTHTRGRVYEGDLLGALPATLRGRIDVLVANVPYVPTEKMHLLARDARTHESRIAHDGGPDGLDVLRRVAVAAPMWLAPDGHLLIETSAHQASRAAGILTYHGLTTRIARCDDRDATVVTAGAEVPPRPRPARP